MRGVLSSLGGACVAIALTAGLVVGSALPYSAGGDRALVRLSWRAVGERVEACRTPTEEELATLPVHMRRTEICEARLSPFRLAVAIDGVSRLDETIRAAGARADRPAYVFEDFPVEPGEHHVEVRFEAIRADGESEPLTLDGRFALQSRDVLLVTREADELTAVQETRPAQRAPNVPRRDAGENETERSTTRGDP